MSQNPFCSCEAGFTPQPRTVFLCIINIVLCWIRQCSCLIRAEPALNGYYSRYITDYRKRQSSLAAHSVWVSIWVISKLLRTSAKKVSRVRKGGGDKERKDEVRQHTLVPQGDGGCLCCGLLLWGWSGLWGLILSSLNIFNKPRRKCYLF